MASQTTYSNSLSTQPGGLDAGFESFSVTLSAPNGETSNTIVMGHGVVLDAGTAKRPTELAAKMDGVAVRTEFAQSKGVYSTNEMVSVMPAGVVYVRPEASVSAGAQAYMRVTTSGAEVAGSFRGDSDSGDAVPVNAYFMEAGSATNACRLLVLPSAKSGLETSVTHYDNAQLTATTTVAAHFVVPTGRVFVVDSVIHTNPTGLAAHATNFMAVTVQNSGGTKVAATWSTEEGEEGTLTAATPATFTNGTLANRTFTGGEIINIVFTEGGAVTFPVGRTQVIGRLL